MPLLLFRGATESSAGTNTSRGDNTEPLSKTSTQPRTAGNLLKVGKDKKNLAVSQRPRGIDLGLQPAYHHRSSSTTTTRITTTTHTTTTTTTTSMFGASSTTNTTTIDAARAWIDRADSLRRARKAKGLNLSHELLVADVTEIDGLPPSIVAKTAGGSKIDWSPSAIVTSSSSVSATIDPDDDDCGWVVVRGDEDGVTTATAGTTTSGNVNGDRDLFIVVLVAVIVAIFAVFIQRLLSGVDVAEIIGGSHGGDAFLAGFGLDELKARLKDMLSRK